MRFPCPSHPAAQAGEMLAAMTADERRNLPHYRDAVLRGKRFLATETAAASAVYLAWKADGSIVAIRIGNHGGITRLWNFGKAGE